MRAARRLERSSAGGPRSLGRTARRRRWGRGPGASWARCATALAVAAVLGLGGAVPAGAGNSGFVSARGGELVLDGRAFRFVGTNAYFLVDAASDGSHAHTDDMLGLAQALGFTVLRTWGFLDGPSAGAALQPQPGVYDEQAFRGMDYVLHKADLAGVRLLVTLVNYWPEYGGMPQYVRWCAPGQPIDAFYTNAWCKQLYKSYVGHVLNRVNTYNGRAYRNDPTILGWELANELRSSDRTGRIVSQWVAEMAAYVKSIDRNHLVGTGEEGFDTTSAGYSPLWAYAHHGWLFDGSVGTSFTLNTMVPDVDFASIHVYPEAFGLPAEAGSTWIGDHIRIARQLGKPLIIGEFGYAYAPWSVYHGWMETFEAHEGAGALIWQILCATVCGNYGSALAAYHPSSSPVPGGMAEFAGFASFPSLFRDVRGAHWARAWIEALHGAAVTSGCWEAPRRYCPDTPVTREQMAVFLLRAKHGSAFVPPACTAPPFEDVPCASPFAPWIAELVRQGVTVGCGGTRYCPKALVTRDQMAASLLRAREGIGFAPPPCGAAAFSDVPCVSGYAPWVYELVRRGIVAGCREDRYCPREPVTRAQMAVLLVKMFGLPLPR